MTQHYYLSDFIETLFVVGDGTYSLTDPNPTPLPDDPPTRQISGPALLLTGDWNEGGIENSFKNTTGARGRVSNTMLCWVDAPDQFHIDLQGDTERTTLIPFVVDRLELLYNTLGLTIQSRIENALELAFFDSTWITQTHTQQSIMNYIIHLFTSQ